jgi:linoleoyl-CoA desaturase
MTTPSLAPRQAIHPLAIHPKFVGHNGFQMELRRRVDEYFETTGKSKRDCPQLYIKSFILFTAFVSLYIALVYFAQTWWQAMPLAVLLGLATASIGLNIQHDGGHGAFSKRHWINRVMARALDLIGGSSYLWHHQHGVLHHTYTNIAGHDSDIDLGRLGRISPHQPRHFFHRVQHYYVWGLYGIMAVRWQLIGDYWDVIRGRVGAHKIPRPKGMELVLFIAAKAFFLSYAFIIPMFFHQWYIVLLYYGIVAMVTGLTLSVVFQLAHSVEEAEFAAPNDANLIDNAWAIHQVESTVDFARNSKLAAWLLGGLNFQIEHHLFPRISHIHYPAMSKIVEQTCREFGVKYHEHPSVMAGIASHFRWLRQMGLPVMPRHAAQ